MIDITVIKKNKERFFLWSLALVLITLPFPKYDINSKSIFICVGCWLFYNTFQEKLENIKANFKTFLLLSSIFWITIFGFIYTQNIDEGLKAIQSNLPFLIFPVILASVKISSDIVRQLLKYFSYSVILASLFALSKAFYLKWNNLGEYFYYTDFALLLDKHTTNFAIFTVVSIACFLDNILNNKKNYSIKLIAPLLFLLFMLYILSVRASIISLICVTLYLLIANRNKAGKIKLVFFGLGILFSFAAFLTPNFQKRFQPKTPEGVEISDIYSRKIHWQAVVSAIKKSNILIGAGSGDGHQYLYDEYRKVNFEIGYIDEYSAHNQYLESVLFHGLIGLMLLLAIIFKVIKINLYNKNHLGQAIMLVFLLFMITDSILMRHSGIVLFSFIISICGFSNTTKVLEDKN